MPVWELDERLIFPDPDFAESDGLLAIGGDLSVNRLILAYSSGIFPWFNLDDETYWFSPDPRCVLYPAQIHISKSMIQVLKKQQFTVRIDHDFEAVIRSCSGAKRRDDADTWIDEQFTQAYIELYKSGIAHSVETYENNILVGGLYGVSLGGCFFGESMFSHSTNASKFAFITLAKLLEKNNFKMIDCQIYNEHLASMGAINIERTIFLAELNAGLQKTTIKGNWEFLLHDADITEPTS